MFLSASSFFPTNRELRDFFKEIIIDNVQEYITTKFEPLVRDLSNSFLERI